MQKIGIKYSVITKKQQRKKGSVVEWLMAPVLKTGEDESSP